MGTSMAILIAQRACGANHEKKPASKAKGNETAAKASSVLLVASPTTMNNAIPPRPMKKAKIENATPFPIPDLMCIRSILSTRFYMERLAAGTKTTPLCRNQLELTNLTKPALSPKTVAARIGSHRHFPNGIVGLKWFRRFSDFPIEKA